MARSDEFTFPVKVFIVQSLAAYETQASVVKALKAEFGLEVSSARVRYYDPTGKLGAGLAPELKEKFFAARKAFLADLDSIPIANKAVRLNHLQRQLDYFADKKAAGIVLQLCEAAAKEVGDVHTNRLKHEMTGKNGGPVKIEDVTDRARARALAAFIAKTKVTKPQS